MKEEVVRTTVDIPASLYRRLKEQSAAGGRSIRELVVAGIKVIVLERKRPPKRRAHFPLIATRGAKVSVTSEDIYEHVEFP